MIIRNWVGRPYTGKTYATAKKAKKDANILGSYRQKVAFRFETVWIIRYPDDNITTVTIPNGKMLIGYNDPYMPAVNQDTTDFCMALCARQIAIDN